MLLKYFNLSMYLNIAINLKSINCKNVTSTELPLNKTLGKLLVKIPSSSYLYLLFPSQEYFV